MKAIAYVRKSTSPQDYEYQINQIKEECIKQNLELAEDDIYGETGSRKVRERPILMKMIEAIKASNEIDFLVVTELSRLGANSKTIEILEILNQKKIGLILIKERIQTLNPDKTPNSSGFLLLSIINGINSFELTTTSYRVKSGFRQSVLENRSTGGLNVPYGYKKVGEKRNSQIVIDEEEEQVVLDIFSKYNLGIGMADIMRYLNDNDIPTRHKKIIDENPEKIYKSKLEWTKQSVYSILKNEIYCGKRKHRTTQKEGTKTKYNYEHFDHAQTLRIISDVDFQKANNTLKSNFSKAGKHQKHTYLLDVQKIKCGCCEHFYMKQHAKYYYCSSTRFAKDSKRKNQNCGNYGIKIESIDRLVQSVIFNNYSDILLNSLSNESNVQRIKELNNLLESYNRELKKILRLEYELTEKMDRLTPEVFDKRLKDIQDMQKKVRISIGQTEKQLRENKEAFEKITNISKLNKKFHTENQQLPASVVNQILNSVTITRIDKCPIELQNLISTIYKNYEVEDFDSTLHKQDKLMLISIQAGNTTLDYIIAQQNYFAYDVQKKDIFVHGFHGVLDSATWFHHLDVNYSEKLIRWLKLKSI